MREVEIRCPVGFRKLFMRMRISSEPLQVTEDNLMEFACNDCLRSHRRDGQTMSQVYHYYSFDGTLVHTVKVP